MEGKILNIRRNKGGKKVKGRKERREGNVLRVRQKDGRKGIKC